MSWQQTFTFGVAVSSEFRTKSSESNSARTTLNVDVALCFVIGSHVVTHHFAPSFIDLGSVQFKGRIKRLRCAKGISIAGGLHHFRTMNMYPPTLMQQPARDVHPKRRVGLERYETHSFRHYSH